LNQGDLDAVMAIEEVLLGVADATIREAGKRKTLLSQRRSRTPTSWPRF